MPHKMQLPKSHPLTLKTLIYSIDRYSNLDIATAAAEMGGEGEVRDTGEEPL